MLSLSLLGFWDETYIFMKVIHELVHQSLFITLLSREGKKYTLHTLCIIGDVKFGFDFSDGPLLVSLSAVESVQFLLHPPRGKQPKHRSFSSAISADLFPLCLIPGSFVF